MPGPIKVLGALYTEDDAGRHSQAVYACRVCGALCAASTLFVHEDRHNRWRHVGWHVRRWLAQRVAP